MRTWSPKDIAERNIETFPFDGDWQRLFGTPGIRFSVLIRGEAKSGKSTFCAKFAQYLSGFGRVLYVSAEERTDSRTLQQRIISSGVTSPKVRFVHLRDIKRIEGQIRTGGYRFVFIDSIQHVKMTCDDWMEMREVFRRRKLSWFLVSQMGQDVTKYRHEVDVLVYVKDGRATVHGRLNKATSIQIFNYQPDLFGGKTL